MPCYSPNVRIEYESGRVLLRGKDKVDEKMPFFEGDFLEKGIVRKDTVPCGTCTGCRTRLRLDWTLRGVHELQMHDEKALFLTLTYSDEYLPEDLSIRKEEMQKFMKRVRKKHKFSYYACGEYGDKTNRPHYHAIIYGLELDDLEEFGRNPVTGDIYYRSAYMEKKWPFGYVIIGGVTFQSIAYVAKYVNKKITGNMAEEHYKRRIVDEHTGEVLEEWQVEPEFQLASRNPALGLRWFQKYTSDCFPKDSISYDGKQFPVPDYYLRKLEELDNELYIKVKIEREYADYDNDTVVSLERLAAMEKCKQLAMENYIKNKKVSV